MPGNKVRAEWICKLTVHQSVFINFHMCEYARRILLPVQYNAAPRVNRHGHKQHDHDNIRHWAHAGPSLASFSSSSGRRWPIDDPISYGTSACDNEPIAQQRCAWCVCACVCACVCTCVCARVCVCAHMLVRACTRVHA